MTVRAIVTIHLPLEMGAVARILKAVAAEYPDAVTENRTSPSQSWTLVADDDIRLTRVDRRAIARDRQRRLPLVQEPDGGQG